MRTLGVYIAIISLLCIFSKESECTIYRGGMGQLVFLDEMMTFEAAERRCLSRNGAQLVELRNEEEWSEVKWIHTYDIENFHR